MGTPFSAPRRHSVAAESLCSVAVPAPVRAALPAALRSGREVVSPVPFLLIHAPPASCSPSNSASSFTPKTVRPAPFPCTSLLSAATFNSLKSHPSAQPPLPVVARPDGPPSKPEQRARFSPAALARLAAPALFLSAGPTPAASEQEPGTFSGRRPSNGS